MESQKKKRIILNGIILHGKEMNRLPQKTLKRDVGETVLSDMQADCKTNAVKTLWSRRSDRLIVIGTEQKTHKQLYVYMETWYSTEMAWKISKEYVNSSIQSARTFW